MDIIIELQSGQDMITVEPASCSITQAVCNDSLQHVENFCDVKLIYDPDLFAFIVAHEQLDAVVKKRDGSVLFTGIAGADASWTDRGEPYPIDGFSLSIKDYTAKLDIKNGEEIALLNVPLTTVLRRLAEDCALTVINGPAPTVALEAFVMPAGRNYRQTLDALCYQYRLSFYFDNLGRLNFFSFDDIPANPPPLDQSQMLAGVKVKKSRKRYDAVQVEYSTLTQKKNEQIFFESFGYNSDDTPAPVIIQPGVYYPFEAAPEIEAAEGKVYQSFVSGYAESRKKYNGELEFRRSRDTGLLYSHNHRVVEDWEGPLAIDREEFESLRASVRFRNTGDTDARLCQFAIRADALYRNKAATVTAGSGSTERSFSTETEFIYQAAYAEELAQSLYRYFSRSGLSVELSTDNLLIPPGSYRAVDTGKSGMTVNALVYSYTLDCEKEIFTYKAISVSEAAVDISRFKSAEADPFRGDPGETGKFTDFRFAANASMYIPPSLNADSDNPGDHWSDGPPAVGTGEYLWMIKSDWRGNERLTPWEGSTRISGPAGDAGQNAVYLDLDNENHSIACDTDGTPKPGTLGFTVQATLYDGMSIVDSAAEGVIWEVVTDAAGITVSNAGTITVSANAVLGDVTKVTVLVLYNALPYIATLTLIKVRDGSGGLNGKDAVVFVLQPSVTAVKRDAGGNLDPPTVSCAQSRSEGGQISVSHELLKCRLSTMANEANYTAGQEIAVGVAAWIEFALYNGAGMELDRERVPVVKDGSPGEDGIGIDALPRDAYAYWPCDDLPEITNNLTQLIDASGNGRHIPLNSGIVPAPGRFGNGIRFLNSKMAFISGVLDGHYGDFAVSVWANKPETFLGKLGGNYSMGFGIRGGRAYFISLNPNYESYAGTAFTEDGNMHHLVAQVKNKVLYLYVDGRLSGQTNIAAYYNSPLGTDTFRIGGLFSAEPAADGTVIDEITVFSRALSDEEILALSRTQMLRNGRDGGIHALLYCRSSSQPATPTENDPSGWYANPPGGDGHLWMITGIKDALGILQGAWSTPVQISGEAGQYTDYRFAKNTSVSTAPELTNNANNPGSNWSDTPSAIGTGEYLWMIQADWRGAARLTNWSTPVRISGPAGLDGTGFNWRGEWVAQQAYAVNDTFFYNGQAYVCIRATATNTNPEIIANRPEGTSRYFDWMAKQGATGPTGNYHEARYMRAATRPATPTGDSPAGWTTDPSSHSGSDPLWMTRGVKDASGVLQGAWNVPVQISGEDGLGIDALPRDAYAYWPCDDLPEIPDNPAGIVSNRAFAYKKATATDVNGMIGYKASLSIDNGSIKSTPNTDGNPNWLIEGSQYKNKIIIARIRYNQPTPIPYIEHASMNNMGHMMVLRQFSDREYLVYYILTLASRNYVWFGQIGGDTTIGWLDQLYIGDASYLTPLIDASGNGKHIPLNGGIIPVSGRFGNGINFLNSKVAQISGILDGHSGDFAVSVWSNRCGPILGKRGDGYSMGFSIQSVGACFISNNPNGEIYAGEPFTEDGGMHHIVAMVKNKVLYHYVDGQLKGQVNIAAYYTGPLGNYPFVIGGVTPSRPGPDAALDEIAIFARALSDEEIRALSKYPPRQNYTHADWLLDAANPQNALQQAPRYRGAVTAADTGNTGIVTINGQIRRMNIGDWVVFIGTNGWTNATCYEWTGSAWSPVPITGGEQNTGKYMAALADICHGAPNATFSAAFIKDLFAQTVNADLVNVGMKLLIGSSADGIEINGPDGVIKSRNYSPNLSGFIIRKNKVSGIQAEFTDISVKNGKFTGSLEGVISGNGHFVINNDHYIAFSNQPKGYLYQTLINRGLVHDTQHTFLMCSGHHHIRHASGYEAHYSVQFIRITSAGCYLCGPAFSYNNGQYECRSIYTEVDDDAQQGVTITTTLVIL